MHRSALVLTLATACATLPSAPPAPPTTAAPTAQPTERPSPFTAIAAFADGVAGRGALPPGPDDPWGDAATGLRHLDQNWGPVEGLWFAYANQGSRLLPMDIFLGLERAGGGGRLASPEVFARHRFLAQAATPNNPDALPVGITRDGDAVGLTCAACHTSQIVYEGQAVRIDGAPALIDFNGFMREIEGALRATQEDDARMAALAARIGAAGDPDAEADLRLRVARSLRFFETYNPNFEAVPGGHGRIDAIGGIINQVVRATSGPGASVPADAPTSFPALWDAPRHDLVQWTGFSSNAEIGSLARNMGQVVGVFGELHVTPTHDESEARAGHASSIRAHHLVDMEQTLWKLQSPAWPEDLLPPIDRSRAAQGAPIYAEHCEGCHPRIVRDDPQRRVAATLVDVDEVGTDPLAVDNLIGRRLPTGVLDGSLDADGLRVLGPTEPAVELLKYVTAGALKAETTAAIRALADARRWGFEAPGAQGEAAAPPAAAPRTYKARPLNGIWATAPYLHNGSVPTLHDLLLPHNQRPARFAVGRWTYDPVKVGYVSGGPQPSVLDTSVPGNGNGGHDYGTSLSEVERRALLEHLKTL